MPFADAFFDGIFDRFFVEHLRKTMSFAEACFRVLKSGSKMPFLISDWESTYSMLFVDVAHLESLSVVTLQTLLDLSGSGNVTDSRFNLLHVKWG
jgi:hypothetical protein